MEMKIAVGVPDRWIRAGQGYVKLPEGCDNVTRYHRLEHDTKLRYYDITDGGNFAMQDKLTGEYRIHAIKIQNQSPNNLSQRGRSKRDYYKVTLSRTKYLNKYIHILVGEAYCQKRDLFTLQCDHIDNDSTNNFWMNIQWLTGSENTKKAQNEDKQNKLKHKLLKH